MQVVLKANWFCPGGYRIRRGEPPSTPVEVPDEFCDQLPSSAWIVDGSSGHNREDFGGGSGDWDDEPSSASRVFKNAAISEAPDPSPDVPMTLSEIAQATPEDPIMAAQSASAKADK